MNAIGRSSSYAVRQWRYSPEHGQWAMLTAQQVERDAPKNIETKSLRMMTYNVWFGDAARRIRIQAILAMVAKLEPDIVCIQEATEEWIAEMTSNDYIQRHYTLSDADGRTLRGYGVVVMSRWVMPRLDMWWLPTGMGRSALIATYTINHETVCVGTVHLESLDNTPVRAQQLEIIAQALAPAAHAGLLGDFNFDSDTNYWDRRADSPLENDNLARVMPGYVDMWPAVHPGKRGLTFDSESNRLIGGNEQARYDRVMWRSTGGRWRPKAMEILGTQPLPGLASIWPSDHFGLFTTLEYHEDEAPKRS